MKNHKLFFGLLSLVLALCITTSFPRVKAEEENVIRIASGETIEIGTDTQARNPTFSWILTKDRVFQNAQRSRFFQVRLSQAGTYVLDVSIQDSSGGGSEYRAFTIIVSDQPSAQAEMPALPTDATPLRAVLRTDLPNQNGKAYLSAAGGFIKIDPSLSEGIINSYDIDIDSTVDTNGDGNPTNDKDTAETLSEKSGTPIYLFTLPSTNPRLVTLSVRSLRTSTESSTQLGLSFGETPPIGFSASSAMSTVSNAGSPIIMEKSGLDVYFRVQFDSAATQGKELLLLWDFGDRTKSLLTSPRHTYGAPGTYPISLSVRDIATGEVLWNGNDTVTIDASAVVTSSASSSAGIVSSESSSSSTTPVGGEKTGFSILSMIYVGMIVLLLIALAVGMYFAVHWIKTKTTGKLQDTIEKLEGTIVKRESKTDIINAAAEPMKMKKDENVPKENIKTEVRIEKTAASNGPVPSWLAKGQTATPSKGAKSPVAPLVIEKTPPPVLPKAPTTPPTQTPDWLKKPPASASTNTQPKVQQPVQTTVPTAKPDAGSVPDWLKPAAPKAAAPKIAETPAPKITPVTSPPAPPAPTTTVATPPPVFVEKKEVEVVQNINEAKVDTPKVQEIAPMKTEVKLTEKPVVTEPKPIAPLVPEAPKDNDPPIAFIQADTLSA